MEEAAKLVAELTRRPESVATVGRIVHYKPHDQAPCRAALVTGVHSALCVDLAVFEPAGLVFKLLVLHVGDGTRPGYDAGTWHWPERV